MFGSDLARRLGVALASPAARDELLSHFGITTFGTVYYVNADTRSNGTPKGLDTNDGLSMGTPLKTVLAAYNKMTSGAHDYCIMSANSGFTFTAELAVTKSRVHFLGLDGASRYFGQGTRWSMSTGGSANSAVVKNTGVRNTFANIKISNSDSSTSFAVADGGEYAQWTNVEMLNTANLGTVTDAHLLCNADSGYYLRCTIGSSQQGHAYTGSRGSVLFSREIITGKVCRDTIFEECLFPIEANSATGCSVFLITGGNDIQRVLWVKGGVMWGSKLSDTINRAIQIDSNLQDGDIFLDRVTIHGIDDVTADSTSSVYHNAAALGSDVSMVAVAAGES